MSRSNPPKPPSTDTSRNEYIPSFIAQKPFFAEGLTSDSDYLEHQRLHAAPKDTLDQAKWYDRGKKLGPASTKYRKGACENCGAMSHKTKECLSRPRKQGAKWTGRDIQADERIEGVDLGWDAKRDRWNGYDAREYDRVVQEYEELEALKTAASASSQRSLQNGGTDATNTPAEGLQYGEETDMGRSQPTSTRQLRLREDTAKYLRDLNPDSAKYDPKTRSMDTTANTLNTSTDNPDDPASDGFIRPSQAEEFEKAQRYAWETQENTALPPSQKLHLQANPTEGAALLKKRQTDDAAKKEQRRQYLLDKYGAAPPTQSSSTSIKSHSPSPHPAAPRQITSSEHYVEYDPTTGKPTNVPPKPTPRSQYPEDVHPNNHTSVFGSWFDRRTMSWGYRCCRSAVKNSYCTGDEGRRAFEEAEGFRTGQNLLASSGSGTYEGGQRGSKEDGEEDGAAVETVHKEEAEQLRPEQEASTDPLPLDVRKDTEEADTLKSAPTRTATVERTKRTLAELQSGVTEEELESYKRNKLSAQDPMATMLGKDELLEKT